MSTGAGSAFIESGGHPGLVRNESGAAAFVNVTYVVPKGVTALRIDKANPGCQLERRGVGNDRPGRACVVMAGSESKGRPPTGSVGGRLVCSGLRPRPPAPGA